MYKFYIEFYRENDGEYILQSRFYDTAEGVYSFLKQIDYIEIGINYGLALMPVRVDDEGEYSIECGERIDPYISLEDLRDICEKLKNENLDDLGNGTDLDIDDENLWIEEIDDEEETTIDKDFEEMITGVNNDNCESI